MGVCAVLYMATRIVGTGVLQSGTEAKRAEPHTAADGGTAARRGSVAVSEVSGGAAPAAERGAFGIGETDKVIPVSAGLR
jgi:hypothetical protein